MLIKKSELHKYLDVDNVYEVKLLDSRWKVEELKNEKDVPSYRITDTKTTYEYLIPYVFGLNQISPNEFAAFKLHDDSNFEMVGYRFDRNEITSDDDILNSYIEGNSKNR